MWHKNNSKRLKQQMTQLYDILTEQQKIRRLEPCSWYQRWWKLEEKLESVKLSSSFLENRIYLALILCVWTSKPEPKLLWKLLQWRHNKLISQGIKLSHHTHEEDKRKWREFKEFSRLWRRENEREFSDFISQNVQKCHTMKKKRIYSVV